MQFPGQGKQPVGIIFDSNFGHSIDNALALALLYGFDGKNELRVVSVSVSKSNLKSAALCDAIGRFYAGSVSGAFNSVARTLPVGLSTDGKLPEDTRMLTGPLEKKNPDGTAVYAHGIHKLNDTAEVTALIRNAFTAQQDQNGIVVLAGPATNLVKVLDLPGVKELIARKIRFLSVAAGAYPSGDEFNIKTDIPAARKLFAEWPTPIVAAGRDIGDTLLYPAASIEKDFGWTPNHPVVDAYRAANAMPYDAPTWDMTSVLYAARPQEGYFKLSDPGTIRVLDNGRTQFTASAEGRHRYLIADPTQKERILKIYTELASAKPVPKVPRFRQQQDKDKPAVEAKPPA